MSALFGSARAVFEVVGELSEKRLVTPKNSDSTWRLYVLKFATVGHTIEVEVSQEEFERGIEQQAYHVTGRIGVVAGRTKLEAESIRLLTDKPASRVSA